MAAIAKKYLDILKRFDDLPNDAVIPEHAAAIVFGMSVWTFRRNLPVPRRRISEKMYGARVGDIRARNRGEIASTTA
jgi:hypothetical protein